MSSSEASLRKARLFNSGLFYSFVFSIIITLHYHTERTDNEFWRNASQLSGSLKDRVASIRDTFLSMNTISFGDDYRVDGEVFAMEAWNSIAKGLKLFDKENVRRVMDFYNINLAFVEKDYQRIKSAKMELSAQYAKHWDVIRSIRNDSARKNAG